MNLSPSPGSDKHSYNIRIEGANEVIGLVIGDNNTVNQNFHVNPSSLPTPREVPLPKHTLFGRDTLIQKITQLILDGQSEGMIALCGMGGSGKSTLAAAIATIQEIESEFSDGCFWVDLHGGDAMEALARIANSFAQSVDNYENIVSRSKAVRSILHDKKVLVVVDNANEEEEVNPFFPANSNSCTITTTRDESLAYTLTEDVFKIESLDTEAATELIWNLSGLSKNNKEDHLVYDIANQFLGALPLALELTAKQIRKEARRPGFSWTKLKDRLSDTSKRLNIGRGDQTVYHAFEQSWKFSLSDDTKEYFALLGLMERGNILSGEMAKLWDLDDDETLDILNELLDLSLIQQTDEVTLRLHPLLHDFTELKLEDISEENKREASHRLCDYHYDRAVENPESMAEIIPVLKSHYYSALAKNSELAKRCFPWYKKGNASSVAIPGFLIDKGFLPTLVKHYQIQLEFDKQKGDSLHAYSQYWLGDAIAQSGDLTTAATHLKWALEIVDNSSNMGDDAKEMARSKFSYRAGQVCHSIGDIEGALHAYQITLEIDKKLSDPRNMLFTMLQMGDLHISVNAPEAQDLGLGYYHQVLEISRKEGSYEPESMALIRLAEYWQNQNPEQSVQFAKEAIQLSHTYAYDGRQGSRYATRLAKNCVDLLYNGQPTLNLALSAFSIAITKSGETQSAYEQSIAFYWLGNLFEHLFLVQGYQAETPAAWACYLLSHQISGNMELPPEINPQSRIETRVLPKLTPEEINQYKAMVENEPLQLIQNTINKTLSL